MNKKKTQIKYPLLLTLMGACLSVTSHAQPWVTFETTLGIPVSVIVEGVDTATLTATTLSFYASSDCTAGSFTTKSWNTNSYTVPVGQSTRYLSTGGDVAAAFMAGGVPAGTRSIKIDSVTNEPFCDTSLNGCAQVVWSGTAITAVNSSSLVINCLPD